ncbi:hypothetical protein PoB_003439500 [Plakobranchus ocellatus]|uniref:Uncharacterized protein n=1 Tax=Plakobranchus ocellatus TaxID=259542 RepID=A0AAV4ALX8_9GAST|nr:hypothetical protein PoB_003439500 [Plakobranchus ocellatus]
MASGLYSEGSRLDHSPQDTRRRQLHGRYRTVSHGLHTVSDRRTGSLLSDTPATRRLHLLLSSQWMRDRPWPEELTGVQDVVGSNLLDVAEGRGHTSKSDLAS